MILLNQATISINHVMILINHGVISVISPARSGFVLRKNIIKTRVSRLLFKTFQKPMITVRFNIHTSRLIKTAIASLLFASFTAASAADVHQGNNVHWSEWAKLSNDTLMKMGREFLDTKDKMDSSMVCYSIIANRYYSKKQSRQDNEKSVYAMNNLGYMYSFIYFDYEKAFYYLDLSRRLSEQNNLEKNLPYVYLNLADLYLTDGHIHNQKNYRQQAIEAYRKAFNAAIGVSDWRILMIILSNMSNMSFHTDSVFSINNEIELFNQLDVPVEVPMRQYTLVIGRAVKAFMNKHYDEALRLLDDADLLIDTKDTPERFMMLNMAHKAEIYKAMGRYDQSIAFLQALRDTAEHYNTKDILVDSYNELYETCLKSGDTLLANRYQFLFLQKKDSLMSHSKLGSVSQMRFLSELKQMNDDMKIMAHKREIQQIWLWISVAMTLLISIFSFMQMRAIRKVKERNRQLYLRSVESLKKEKYKGNSISDYEKQDIIDRIEQVMACTDEICSEQFNLARLAELVGSNYKNVSQIINDYYQKNFNQLLAEHRIKEACKRINDPEHYAHYTIEAIATSVGIRSRSNFGALFKRIVGLSPSEYLKMARENKD